MIAVVLVRMGKVATRVHMTALAVPQEQQNVQMACARPGMARIVCHALKIVTAYRMETVVIGFAVVMGMENTQ